MKIVFSIIFLASLVSSVVANAEEVPLIRSLPDKGKYYVMDVVSNTDTITAISKRVGVFATGFTKVEMDCANWKMRELGYGEGAIANIKGSPTKWFELVPGSSKSDLAKYLCSERG